MLKSRPTALNDRTQMLKVTEMISMKNPSTRSRRGHPQGLFATRLSSIAACIFVLFCCNLSKCSARSPAFKSPGRVVSEDGGWSVSNQSGAPPRISPPEGFVGGNDSGDCTESYGFLPCSTTLAGNLFLVLAYGFCLLKAAQLLSDGSELLLTVLNPGIIGGLVLPILGSFPDALLILVSGIAGSKEEAQSQILVGMGLLAGSTVMLLTIVWGGCLIVGRSDLQDVGNGKMMMKPRTLTKKFSLFETGVSTDSQTKIASRIMMITLLPYIVVQVPRFLGYSVSVPIKVISCALAISGLFGYCGYQVAFPWVQERRIAMARERYQKLLSLKKASQFSRERWGSLLNADGSPNKDVLERLFSFADTDKDQKLSEGEVRGLILGLGLPDASKLQGMEIDNVVDKWMSEFDIAEADQVLSTEEFIEGMSKWIKNAIDWSKKHQKGKQKQMERMISHAANDAESSLQALLDENGWGKEEGEEEEGEGKTELLTTKQVVIRAVLQIGAGAALAAIFADPLVDAIDRFSTLSGVPSFFVSFVATPFVTNSSELVSSIVFSSKKRKRHLTLAYSQIYGSVTMNNTLCMGVFLTLGLARGLTWNFSSEVLSIVVVTLIMGSLSAFKITFPLWMAFLALFLYPASIALVAILDYVFGWT